MSEFTTNVRGIKNRLIYRNKDVNILDIFK